MFQLLVVAVCVQHRVDNRDSLRNLLTLTYSRTRFYFFYFFPTHRRAVARVATGRLSLLFLVSPWRSPILNALPVPCQGRFPNYASRPYTCANSWKAGYLFRVPCPDLRFICIWICFEAENGEIFDAFFGYVWRFFLKKTKTFLTSFFKLIFFAFLLRNWRFHFSLCTSDFKLCSSCFSSFMFQHSCKI